VRRWSASSSTSRQRSLGRAGSTSGGGVADAEELGAEEEAQGEPREEGEDGKAKFRTNARRTV
jgi:hypothetical protein